MDPSGRRTSSLSTQFLMAPGSPGVNPEALHAIAPPTMASVLLVGSTGKIRAFALRRVTSLLRSSRMIPAGDWTVAVPAFSRTPGVFMRSRETRTPPWGVALPVRFDLPADMVQGIFAVKQARAAAAHSRSLHGRHAAEAAPGRFELSTMSPLMISGSSSRTRPNRSRSTSASEDRTFVSPGGEEAVSIMRQSSGERISSSAIRFVIHPP